MVSSGRDPCQDKRSKQLYSSSCIAPMVFAASEACPDRFPLTPTLTSEKIHVVRKLVFPFSFGQMGGWQDSTASLYSAVIHFQPQVLCVPDMNKFVTFIKLRKWTETIPHTRTLPDSTTTAALTLERATLCQPAWHKNVRQLERLLRYRVVVSHMRHVHVLRRPEKVPVRPPMPLLSYGWCCIAY